MKTPWQWPCSSVSARTRRTGSGDAWDNEVQGQGRRNKRLLSRRDSEGDHGIKNGANRFSFVVF
jgi:hypothetical protein